MAKENTFGVVPCSVKPDYTEKKLENLPDANYSIPIITTSEELCSCGLWQCEVMPTARSAWDADCVIMQLEIGCISEHDQFDFNCFYVVFIQFMIFKKQHVRAPDKSSKK